MQARMELVIRDGEGNILSQLDPYLMELDCQSLHEIEGAVEDWKQKILPDIEANLLDIAQSQFTQQTKKQSGHL
ncbi:MAG: hypothetical protein JO235_05735 [Chroococcidiopsidaceae cyanobacterium CP_BM_RX_35]|nr:hypothetical protein [Chroococcidiopsidaceae cyanobacterium CP_BM_RX_35]